MLYHEIVVGNPLESHAEALKWTPRVAEAPSAFRLQVNVRRGNGSNLPGAWSRYPDLDAARSAARELLKDDRVLRVTVVEDAVPPRFIEWVNR